MPLQKWQQDKCFVNGELERDDLELANDAYDHAEDARLGKKQAWEVDPVQGPRRVRPLVPVQPAREMDPHEYVGRDASRPLLSKADARRQPMTGACQTLQPQWRRKPRYVTLADGRAEMCLATDVAVDAAHGKRAFFDDARLNVIRSHMHVCKPTCFKCRGATDPASRNKVCRFNHQHSFEVAVFKRRVPRKRCGFHCGFFCGPKCGARGVLLDIGDVELCVWVCVVASSRGGILFKLLVSVLLLMNLVNA